MGKPIEIYPLCEVDSIEENQNANCIRNVFIDIKLARVRRCIYRVVDY